MNKANGIYFLGRIIKIGFDSQKLIDILFHSKPIQDNDFYWNFVDVVEIKINEKIFYFGKLIKARSTGKIMVLGEGKRKEIQKEEPDMVVASSPFVYIPEFSGIAFLSVWNFIEPRQFRRRFCQLIMEYMDNFFVDCDIILLTDLLSFYERLNQFDVINCIKAKVNPPNPLFGKLWESLKEYLSERKADELHLKELSKKAEIFTKIKELIKLLLEGDEAKIEKYLSENKISLVDAALLMSLDGYGVGKIEGIHNNKHVYIQTHEKFIHISLPKDVEPIQLFNEAIALLKEISNERYMEH